MPRSVENGLLNVEPGEVAVRMYRQGLGDCFLLAFGGASEPRYLLIDCGVHARQDRGPERMTKVLEDIKVATGGRLDVVVVTQECADHISGIVQQRSPFLVKHGGFEIDQLWLAWTEQVGDELADKLRKRREMARTIVARAVETAAHAALSASQEQQLGLESLAQQLRASAEFEQEPQGTDYEAALRVIENSVTDRARVRALQHRVADRASVNSQDLPSANELALGVLQARAKTVQFCRPGDLLNIDGIDGVRVHVLGPPHDELKLKERDTDRYQETYMSSASQSLSFGLSPALGAESVDAIQYPDDLRNPFDATRRRKLDFAFPEDEQFEILPAETRQVLDESYYDPSAAWRRIDTDWLSISAELALNLNSDTNNTSLVLAIEWNGRVLLFVGDAQVGSWLSWRDQKYKDERGQETISVDTLLERTVLYKVGQHGGRNATAKRDPERATANASLGAPYGLELMRDIVALMPVDRDAAEKDVPHPWEMPHEPLYQRLREKAHRRVLRADAKPNTRPLPTDSLPDVTPQTTFFEPVPDLPGAKWRRSKEKLSSAVDPLFYEIVFSRTAEG